MTSPNVSKATPLGSSWSSIPRSAQTAWNRLLQLPVSPNLSTIGIAVLCTVAAWPVIPLAPTTGLDPSWQSALAMSSIHHLAWGPRLDFTYGPLGFLTIRTLYFGSTAGLAFLYQFVVEFALFVLLIRFTRTTLPLLLAVFVSFGIGATAVTLTDSGDLLIPPAFLLGVLAVRCQQRTTREWLIAAISVLSALGFLIKFGDGLVPLGIVAVLIAVASGSQRIRGSVIAVAAFLSSLLVAWTATGNNLGALFDYFKYSSAVAKGYSSSMQLESGRTDEWWYAAIILAMLAWLAWASVRTASQREQLGTAAILTVYSWWALKEGFVRHDGHDLVFFGSIFVAFVVVGVISPRFRPMYIAIVAFVAVIAWTAAGAVPSNVVALSADAHAFGHPIGHNQPSSNSDARLICTKRQDAVGTRSPHGSDRTLRE